MPSKIDVTQPRAGAPVSKAAQRANWAAARAELQHGGFFRAIPEGVERLTAAKLSEMTSLKDYGAAGNGSTNDKAAFDAVPTGGTVLLTPGIYWINGNTTIDFHIVIQPGAVLAPNSGTTVTWAAGYTVTAGHYQILGGDGAFAKLNNILGRLSAAWARGNDLGAKLNNLISWGGKRFHIPGRADGWTISTPVVVERDCEFSGDGMNNEGHSWIYCQTNKKAVFEMLPGGPSGIMLNVKFENLSFHGQSTRTPACLFWCAAGAGEVFTAGIRFERISAWGHWGIAVVYDVSTEEARGRDCRFTVQGTGDYGATNCPRRGAVVHSQSHAASELTATSGRRPGPRSHSAWSWIGGEYAWRAGGSGNGVFVLLNNCWDMTFRPDYMDCNSASGGFYILDHAVGGSPASAPPGIYGIRMGQMARTESATSAPFLLVDGDGKNWPMRGIVLEPGTHHSPGPFILGVTGNEQLENLAILPGWVIYNTNVLIRGISKIIYSSIDCRGRRIGGTDMQIQTSSGSQIGLGTLQGGAGNYTRTLFSLAGYNNGVPFQGS